MKRRQLEAGCTIASGNLFSRWRVCLDRQMHWLIVLVSIGQREFTCIIYLFYLPVLFTCLLNASSYRRPNFCFWNLVKV